MKKCAFIILIFISLLSCKRTLDQNNVEHSENLEKVNSNLQNTNGTTIDLSDIKFTNGFDFAVGKPDAKGYYNAQKFTENNHLGDDWNGVGGGNSDLGDSIYSIANGYVVFAENIHGGWGNVIRIVHFIDKDTAVESLYAHCDEIFVNVGDYVDKGDKIAAIGNNDGQYWAHLHLEIRSEVGLPVGGGYSYDTTGYLDPTEFIQRNR